MDPKKAYDLLMVLTSTGFITDSFELKIPLSTRFHFERTRGDLILKFDGELPTVKIKKIITITKNVQGIELDRLGGKIYLENFPDLPFEYEWFNK